MAKGKLYGVGLGPGDPELITMKAVNALRKADVIFAPKSKEQASTALQIASPHLSGNARVEQLEFSMAKDVQTREQSRQQNARIIASHLDEGKTVAFLTLGDPMLYSTYTYVLEQLQAGTYDIETIPGIYSFGAISNLLNVPLCTGEDSVAVISCLGEREKMLFDNASTIVCMKVSSYNKELHQLLQGEPCDFYLVTDAGKPSQVQSTSLQSLMNDVPYFSTAIVKKSGKWKKWKVESS